jgi:hypothetical protein
LFSSKTLVSMPSSKKNSQKQVQLKSILRAGEFCSNVMKKVVRFCEELNQTLLITPRQVLRRSQRNRKDNSEPEPQIAPAMIHEFDETQSEQESDPMNESYLTQRAQKVSKRLVKAVQKNNSHAKRSDLQIQYYNRVKRETERRVLNSKE